MKAAAKSLALATCAIAVVIATQATAEPLEGLAGKTVGELSWAFATQPACFELPEENGFPGVCAWQIYERLVTFDQLAERYEQRRPFAVVCALAPGSTVPTVASCSATSMLRHSVSSDTPSRLRKKATAAMMNSARTLAEMTHVVGDVPEGCTSLPSGGLVCQWAVLRTTPGQRTIARWGRMNERKMLRLICRFPSASAPRGEDSCKVSLLD
jgi:hypothetical protein